MYRLTSRALILPPPGLRRLTAVTVTTTAVKSKSLLRLTQLHRSFAVVRTRPMDLPPPFATSSGVDDVITVDEVISPNINTDRASEVNDSSNHERKVLPPELSRSVVTLTCESAASGGVCDVYLVGTAHVSKESCQEVQAVINFLKPQVVFLELCSTRAHVLVSRDSKVPTMRELLGMLKRNENALAILLSWFLAKVASKLDVFPGAEFRVAYEEALKYGGKVVLGDRPAKITLQRTWAKMPLWHKTKLLYSLSFQSVFLPKPKVIKNMLKEMDDVDTVTLVIQELSKQFPTLMETLVHERDQIMSAELLRIASKHNSVVAVVGKGHLRGIEKNWKQPVDVKQLMSTYESKTITMGKVVKTVGVAAAAVGVLSGVYLSRKK